MQKKDYIHYSFRELLRDDYFLNSHIYPTDESRSFWKELQKQNKQLAQEITRAQEMIRHLPVRQSGWNTQTEEVLYLRIIQTIRTNRKKKKKIRILLQRSAAAAILLICLSGLIHYLLPEEKSIVLSIEAFEKPLVRYGDEVQLIQENKEELTLIGEAPSLHYNEEGELSVNSQRVDTGEKGNKSPNPYHQLIVPPGKRAFITLSDGTHIWVNANSRVVYPEQFEKNKREILVEGEVFIEVTPDLKRPFFVKADQLEVNVLGTSFNLTAYGNGQETAVVLVSGKVNVQTKTNRTETLRPNDRLSFHNETIEIRPVDTNDYTSWIKGTYTFNNEDFSVILTKLSNYYGKEFRWDKEVENLPCGGSLDLKEDLNRVLKGLEQTVPVIFREQEDHIEVIVNQ